MLTNSQIILFNVQSVLNRLEATEAGHQKQLEDVEFAISHVYPPFQARLAIHNGLSRDLIDPETLKLIDGPSNAAKLATVDTDIEEEQWSRYRDQ